MIIADTSAFMAMINREAGWEVMQPFADSITMSAVNVSEAVASMLNRDIPETKIYSLIEFMIAETVSFDRQQALLAASLRLPTKPFGLSLGDRACIALGMRRNLPIFTADKIWAELKLDADIRLIR